MALRPADCGTVITIKSQKCGFGFPSFVTQGHISQLDSLKTRPQVHVLLYLFSNRHFQLSLTRAMEADEKHPRITSISVTCRASA